MGFITRASSARRMSHLATLLFTAGLAACIPGEYPDAPSDGSTDVSAYGILPSGKDIDHDGKADGFNDPIIHVDNRVCVHESIVNWSGKVYSVGYGYTGAEDWSALIHEGAPSFKPDDDETWFCGDYNDFGDVYRVNFTRLGSSGPADFTNWADLTNEARHDELVWINSDHTLSLCFTVDDGKIVTHNGNDCEFTGVNPDTLDTDGASTDEQTCYVDVDGDGLGNAARHVQVPVDEACPSGFVNNHSDTCDEPGGCGTDDTDTNGGGNCVAGESQVSGTFTVPSGATFVDFQLELRDGQVLSGSPKSAQIIYGKVDAAGHVTNSGSPGDVIGSYSALTGRLTVDMCVTNGFTVFLSSSYRDSSGDMHYMCEGSGTRNGTATLNVNGSPATLGVWVKPASAGIGCELSSYVGSSGGGSGALYCDNDGDGYKSKWSSTSCTGSSSTTAGTDCGDNDDNVYPGATERLNGVDDDCDGQIDEGLSSSTDLDHDGYTVAGGDCNDNVASVHQGANEVVGDGIDQDCNGHDSCFVNNDQDVYGTSGTIDAVGLTCLQLQGRATVSGDCNDSNPSIYPGAIEVSNGFDDNCDGTIDNVGSGGSYFGQCTGNTAAVRVAWDALYDASSLQIEVYSGVITSGQAKSGTQLGLSRIQGSSITGTAAIGHTAGHHVELTMQPCFPLPFTVFAVGQDVSNSYSISSNGTVSGVTNVYVDRGTDGTSNPYSVTPQSYSKYGGTGYEYSYVVQ